MKRTLLLLTLFSTVLFGLRAQSVSNVVLQIDGANYYIDTVRMGQTTIDFAERYDVEAADIEAANYYYGLVEGEPVRIPCSRRVSTMAPRRDDKNNFRYRIADGDTAFSIAVANALSLDVLVDDNPGIDLADISRLRYLNIRLYETGKTQTAEIAAATARYAAILNRFSSNHQYVLIEAGQTLYSIARANEISVDELNSLNGNPAVLGRGMILKLPRREQHIREWIEPDIIAEEQPLEEAEQEIIPAEEFDGGVLNVALLLPLTEGTDAIRGSFVEFFNGALLAAQDLKADGHSIELNLYDTQNNEAVVDSLVASGVFDTANLIIGPVYERNMAPAAQYASARGIPIVSPLATVEGAMGESFYQIAPVARDKYAKMNDAIAPETNVIFIYTSTTDLELEREMTALAGDHPITNVVYNDSFEIDSLVSRPIEDVMTREDNLFVVLSDTELEVDRTLAIISSIMNSRQPRYPTRRVPIRVLGSSKWTRYRNLDKNLLFKLDVQYAANYHADRGNEAVRRFDRRYTREFGRLPSLYAYRAYDVLRIFGEAAFAPEGTLAERINTLPTPLQTHYTFEQIDGSWRNTEWVVVNYNHDYSISAR